MSDDVNPGTVSPDEVREESNAAPGKHGGARALAEAALRAQGEGDDARAEELFTQATRTDPDAVIDVLQETGADAAPDARDVATDRDVELETRQVRPGSDAPSRAGITGSGSGADSM